MIQFAMILAEDMGSIARYVLDGSQQHTLMFTEADRSSF